MSAIVICWITSICNMDKIGPSLQELIVFSEWKTGSYTTTVMPLPNSTYTKQKVNIMRFKGNQSIVFKMYRYDDDTDVWVEENEVYSFGLQHKQWEFFSGKGLWEELSQHAYVVADLEMRLLCQAYAMKELKVDKDFYNLGYTFSNDYRSFACLSNETVVVLLELYKELSVQKISKAHDVQFSFY